MNRKQVIGIFIVGTFFGFGMQYLLDQAELSATREANNQLEDQLKSSSKALRSAKSAKKKAELEHRREEIRVSQLSDTLKDLEEHQLREYVSSRNLKRKLELADKMLGDIFLSFMGHVVSFKVSQSNQKYFKSKSSSQNKEWLVTSQRRALPRSSQISKERSFIPPPKAEGQLMTSYSEKDITKNRGQLVLKDAFKAMKNAKALKKMTPILNQLQGNFTGEVRMNDPKLANYDMELDFDGRIEDQQLKGQMRVQLSKEGKAFSTSNGRGSLKDLKQFEGSEALMIVSGESHVFQLFYLFEKDAFTGHYYKKIDIGNYRHQGVVELTRL